MRWQWWSGRTSCRKALAGIFRRTPRPQLCMRLPLTISCGPRQKPATATLFTFRVTPPLTETGDRDIDYFQGHAPPGIYARAYLEGRIPKQKLENFRRELKPEGGLSSYPHPWLMPDFWEFPTVSMGLGPIQAIYQARFMRYLENRGLKETQGGKVWAFLGDGEMDEPESLGSITLASRER